MKEIRSLNDAEFRSVAETRQIEGYALLFDKESQDLGGFIEVIDKNALEGVLEVSDVLALYNHDEDKVLARNTMGTGTLSLEIDAKGLKYRFNAPKTSLGDEVLNAIERGDLRNSSFAFTTNESGVKWEKRGDKYLRKINQFERIFDVSPVFRPAYLDTSVAARSLEALNKELIEARIEPIPEPDIIEINYQGNTYNIPFLEPIKEIVVKTDNERDLTNYLDNLEKEVNELKK